MGGLGPGLCPSKVAKMAKGKAWAPSGPVAIFADDLRKNAIRCGIYLHVVIVSPRVWTMSGIMDQIRKAIAKGQKTRYRISQETGISESQLSRFVKGQCGVSVEAMEQLAECLGLQIVVRPKKKQR